MIYDYLVVGAGLTGATIARALTDAGRNVAVVERAAHVGGLCYDAIHPSGQLYGLRGPHYFRTSSDEIWDFVNRFATFRKYEARVLVKGCNGISTPWPLQAAEHWEPAFTGIPHNFEQYVLSLMPERPYVEYVKGYTEKMWNCRATDLPIDLAKRFDVRRNGDTRLTPKARHQGLPTRGYTDMIKRMLEGIPVMLNEPFDPRIHKAGRLLIYTGALDAYFGHILGVLPYRTMRRDVTYHRHIHFFQPAGQVNNACADRPDIRSIEWKDINPLDSYADDAGTLVTTEYPQDAENDEDAEYPVPTKDAQELAGKYRELARAHEDVLICGRLGNYRYQDMDHSIGQGLALAKRIL